MIRNKVDLHLHIDGSVNPVTVYELSRKYNIEPECYLSLEQITNSMMIPEGEYDPDFLTFEPPLRVMQNREGLYRISKELVKRLDDDGLVYAELRFAPQYHLNNGLSQEEVVLAVIDGINDGLKECKQVNIGLILCMMNHKDAKRNYCENLETLHLANKYLHKGVNGIDLAGYEDSMDDFKQLFDLAINMGIPATTHSEFTVKDALKYDTKRIGHGYQAALLEELTNEVIEKGITLEMCPDSSLSYEYGLKGDHTHPLVVLYQKGARVTVNTDNLTVLNTSLEYEYSLCYKMGLTDADIYQMNRYAIEASFASEELKEKLLKI